MYSLLILLSVLCTACFLHVFVHRRRKYLPWFAITLVAMLYTHLWSAFYVLGTGTALLWMIWRSQGDQRRGLLRDAVLGFGGAGLLYLPWLPTAIYQMQHTAAPWAQGPTWRAAQQLPRTLVGTWNEIAITAITAASGIFLAWRGRRNVDDRGAWTALAVLAWMVSLSWTISNLSDVWVPRYFSIFFGLLVLTVGWAFSRAGVIGLAGLVLLAGLWLEPHTPRPTFKSNVSLVAADGAPYMQGHGAIVLSTHPEQIPLIYLYMKANGVHGERYATEMGFVPDPQVMDWRDGLTRLEHTRVSRNLEPMLSGMAPGERLYLIRPVLSRKLEWTAPWTSLVKTRTYEWVRTVHQDPRFKLLHVSNAWLQAGYRNGAVRGEMYVKTRR